MKNIKEIIKNKEFIRFVKELNIHSFKEKSYVSIDENTEKNKDILQNKFFIQKNKKQIKQFRNKALNNFYQIIKNFTELDVIEKDGHYIAIGETKKYRKILQACFFTFNNRHEEWRFTEFRQQNYFADLKLKELQAEIGVHFKF